MRKISYSYFTAQKDILHKIRTFYCEKFLFLNAGTLQEKEEIVNKRLGSGTLAFEQELYNTEFAKRLDYIISLINQANTYGNKINLESLAESLAFPSVNELKCYYIKNKEPDFVFIEKLADKLGVNVTWLKTGINATPFLSKLYRRNELSLSDVYFVPEDIFNKMEEGTVYPGIMRNYSAGQRREVLYDFIDIEHSFWTMEECKAIYGEGFLKIQEIVKRKCDRR